ncbi:amino acid adenylation domain-containing protein [Kitasatospora sp. NPDC096077]|uniref:amino acid adenylation domain-containing protein n=1 Tax=Kitasatospora sp. NPDC096077 TaxID=3155544 RepID=UPI0033203DE8
MTENEATTTNRGAVLPLTAAQAEIWFDEQFAAGPLAYNMADYIDLRGPLDPELLGRALQGLGHEAEGLRVQFVEEDGGPGQIIRPLARLPLKQLDFSGRPEPLAAAEQWMRADHADPIKITDFPLFRGALLRLGPDRHLLYLCMHHILADGFSRGLLYPKLSGLYTRLGAAAGGDPETASEAAPDAASEAEVMPPFHRLLDAERKYLDSKMVDKDRAYWTDRLTSDRHGPLPELVSLSEQEPAPARVARRETVRLSPETTTALHALAQDGKVTLPVLMVAATAAYTQRVTGVEAPLLTLPVTGRVGAVNRAIPGMLANYLPLAVRIRPELTRTELLRAAWREVARALQHQRYRGDRIRRDIGLRIDDQRAFGPFINVLDQDPELAFGPDCRGVVVNLSTGIVKDLILTVLNAADGTVELHLDGNPALYTAAELATHLARFATFLDTLATMPADRPIGQIGLGAAGEPLGLLGDRDTTAAPDQDLVERVRAIAAEHPEAVAVRDGRERVGYRQLLTRAAGTAARLSAARAGRGSLVAVLAEPGAPFVTGVLAVQAVGAAYLPLDPAAPAARNAALLTDSGATHLLLGAGCTAPTGTEHTGPAEHAGPAERTGPAAPAVLPLSDPSDAACSTELPAVGSGLDLAYVMFTSGSTGRPKGAMVHRAGMMNHLWAKVRDLDLAAGEALIQNAPLTFDVSVWQMFAPLIVGGSVRVAGAETAADPHALFTLARDEAVAVLEVVPSLLRAALDAWDLDGDAPRLPELHWLVVTGEALPADLCRRWQARYPDVPMMNAYGPTECSDDVTHAVIAIDDELDARVPIGSAVRNTRLYVLSDELQPVPVGVPGELYVGGAGVGRGYLHDPARTATTFPADPFTGDGTRMYRTGDRVVQRPDGQLEFIERRDHQIKIRGRRVETGEIEAVLRTLDTVTDAAVAVLPDTSGNPRLIGYLTGPDVRPGHVRAELAQLLPAYMIPATWLVLDALPLTANGKLDRKALPQPDPAAQDSSRGPRTERERILCDILAEVLGTTGIGIDEDFFALGGDSIRSIQVVSRARRAGLLFTTRDMFTHKTAAALARIAGGTDTPAPDADEAAREREHGTGPYELTPISAQLHADTGRLDGPVADYAQYVVVRVPVELDADLLDTALHALVDHHDALRTRATEPSPGLWHLEALPPGALTGVRLATAAESGGQEDVPAFAERQAAAARTRLDPGAAVMLQAVLIPAAPEADSAHLVLCAHHLVIDGVSWRILLPDLAAACTALAEGRTPAPDPVGTSYRAWSRLLADQARTQHRGAELAHWQRTLDGPDPLVGSHRLDPATDVYGTRRTLRLELGPEVTGPLLTDLPAAFHAEVNDVLLTGLAIAVADWRRRHGHADHTRTLIELEGHGREQLSDRLDLSRTVGWFTAAFPVRLDPGEPDWDELWSGGPALAVALKRIKEQLRALPDRGVGYGLLRYLNPHAARVLAGRPGPQIGFNYMGRFDARRSGHWEPAGGDGVVGTGAHPDLPLPHLLDVTPATEDRPDGPHLIANWSWAGRTVAEEDARDVAETWFRALELLARYPGPGGRTPSDLPLVRLDQAEIDEFESELAAAGTELLDVLPLTPLQQGMLFHADHDAASAQDVDVYTLQIVADIEGELDPAALRAAGQALLDRHPNLRSAFRARAAGEPVQVVPRHARLPWLEADLTELPEPARAAELDRITEAERTRRFDPAAPPLLRFALLSHGEDRHRFVWTSHHILVDGWSMPLLVRELFALSAPAAATTPAAATISGAPGTDAVPLPDPAPYRSYLAWLTAQDRTAARTAWREALADLDGPTLLVPADHGRAPALPRSVHTELPPEATAALTRWARGRGLTLNTVVQGCWAVLLGRLTGRQDVLFGAVTSGRPAEVPEVESMIGMFLTTVPVRARLHPDTPLAELLHALQDRQSALLPHEHLGLAAIHRAAGLTGEAFDTVVLFENFPLDERHLAGGAGPRVVRAEARDARHHPLSLVVHPGEALSLRLDHHPELFGRDTAERIARILLHLLHTVTERPELPLARIDVTAPADLTGTATPGELGGLLGHWDQSLPEESLGVVERIRAVAERTPEAVAVTDADGPLRYRELVAAAGHLSALLTGAGVGTGSVVALLAEPGAPFIAGVLGVLGAGAAYLPLDPAAPDARNAALLADSGADRLLLGAGHRAPDGAGVTVLGLEQALAVPVLPAPNPLPAPASLPEPVGGGLDLAYVMFTSGSTGRPKGAMVHRAGMMNHLWAKVRDLDLAAGEALIQNAPLTFDVSVWQMFAPLIVGGSVRVAGTATAADPTALFGLVRDEGVAVLEVVPSLLRAALDAWDLDGTDGPDGGTPELPSLRWLVVTGEALPADLCRRWHSRFPDVPMMNAYGPTECSDDVTHAVVGHGDQLGARVPIGGAVRNTRLYVLSDELQPVPVGVPGELYVGGAGVGRGYLHDPARTATTFPADPFTGDGTRMYRTGDRVIQRPDGQLEFIERRDHQIKIRGRRVETGEIEAVLRTLDTVTDAAVTVLPDTSGNPRLIGYLTGPGVDPERIRHRLAELLPGYMVPSSWLVLDALPLTTNGKLDRKALPRPEAAEQTGHRGPRTESERILCEILAEVLGTARVGIDEDFFTLGGDSIRSIQVVSRARKAGLTLTTRDVFTHRTAAALALLAEEAAASADGAEPAPPEPTGSLVELSDEELADLELELNEELS